MENKTNYGRKVVRKSPFHKNTKQRNFMIYTIIVFLLGILVGGVIFTITHNTAKAEPAETDTTIYGVYDESIIQEGMNQEWIADDSDFIPLDCALDVDTQKFVYSLCEGYEIDFTFAMALIQKESSFKPDAVSGSNDFGLMQINKINHEWLSELLGITDFLDAEQNIKAGMFILRGLFEKYNEPELVLMAYNMGETGANRLWQKDIYSTNYTEDIMEIQKGFIEQLNRKEGTN